MDDELIKQQAEAFLKGLFTGESKILIQEERVDYDPMNEPPSRRWVISLVPTT